MHNSYPQLGYFHKGLGAYIHLDSNVPQMGSQGQMGRGQMGDLFSDLWGSVTGGVSTAGQSALDKVKDAAGGLTQSAKNEVISNFLDTGTGQAVVEDAKKSWLEQQTDKVKTIYVQNKAMINTGLIAAGGLVVLYMLLKARSSGKAAAKREMTAPTPVAFAGPAPVAANPRRKKRKHSRRKNGRK